MLRSYNFLTDGGCSIRFDDQRPVSELMKALFDQLGYEEPFGMEIVTVFQPRTARGADGWFIRDPSLPCAEALDAQDDLLIAYHMPGVFYHVEGGFGTRIGNHPDLEDSVSVQLVFEDFSGVVAIAGKYTVSDIVHALEETGYIRSGVRAVTLRTLSFSDDWHTALPLFDASARLPLRELTDKYPQLQCIVIE